MRIMANKNFGNIGDVWKHVVLAEVLERERPACYAETHAGSGAYAVVHSGGREYSFVHFLEVAPRFAVLAQQQAREGTRGRSAIQRDRPDPGSRLFGQATSRTRCQSA